MARRPLPPNRYPDGYASHAHVLAGCVTALVHRGIFRERPRVIELGMGFYSTLLLRALATGGLGTIDLWSFESDQEWARRFQGCDQQVLDWEHFSYPQTVRDGRTALVFVDHADIHSRTRHAIEALAFSPLVVIHDASYRDMEPNALAPRVQALADAAQAWKLCNRFLPGTLVASNFWAQDALDELLRDVW